jgi:hypothetical protein
MEDVGLYNNRSIANLRLPLGSKCPPGAPLLKLYLMPRKIFLLEVELVTTEFKESYPAGGRDEEGALPAFST